jgi:hypothetical protein
LVEEGAGDLLPAFAALPNVELQVAGRLLEAQVLPGHDFHALTSQLAALPEQDGPVSAFLVLGNASTTLYRYASEGLAA